MDTRFEPDQAVAVVGVACRFPGADTPDAFWELLCAGSTGIGPEPADRAGTAGPSGQAGYLGSVDGFDAEFFGLSPREVAVMDPQQRLMLELAWEALEHAGSLPGALHGSQVGVFVGAIGDDYATLARRGGDAEPHSFTGQQRGIIANRVSYTLGLTGPSLLVDTAQSSALVAVHLACESVRRGESPLALAGGVNLILAPETTAALAEFGALSPDGRCFTLDARANGYVRGEGGGLVVLKRLDAALADGDRVLCVIRGGAVNSDGATDSLPTPGAAGQESVLRAAYRNAAVPFAEVDYVELHGSATRVGDRVEAAALGAVFADTRPDGVPLAVGSVKTNVGHLEGAAGIAGLIKAVLCVAHRTLVPSLNHVAPDPSSVPLERLGLRVQQQAAPWPRAERVLVAGVSSFGVGGTNCHLVLSDLTGVVEHPSAGQGAVPGESDEETFLHWAAEDPLPWVLSADSEKALHAQASRLHRMLTETEPERLGAVGRALVERRTAFEHRAVALASDRGELGAELRLLAAGRPSRQTVAGHAAPGAEPVFVFPGQGSQWPGMAVRLLDSSPVFARRFDACADALREFVDWSPQDVLRGRPDAPPLDRVDVVQPLLWSVMVSLAELWRAAGVEPAAVVGHSQGELAAATVIGALSLTDAARIVVRRSAALLRIAGQGGMVSVLLPEERIRQDIAPWEPALSVAAVNGPGQCIVGGDPAALTELTGHYDREGVSWRRVHVDVVSHCAQVEVFREELLAELADVRPMPSAVPFYSTVTGGLLDPETLDADYWYRNLRQEVRFSSVVQQLLAAGRSTFIEISPHPVLATGLSQNADQLGVDAVTVGTLRRSRDDTHSVLRALAEAFVRGVPVRWERVLPAATGGPGDWVDLPTYPFQRRRYWLDQVPAAPGPGPAAVGAPASPDISAAEPDTEPGLRGRLAGLSASAASQTVLALVRDQAAAVMGLRSGGEIRSRRTFKDLGFDSSMIVALRGRLAAATGLRLPVDVLYGHPTPGALAEHLVAELRPEPATRALESRSRKDDRTVPGGDLAAAVASASVEELLALIDNSLH